MTTNKTTTKTKKAPVLWNYNNIITCVCYGEKDPWGKAIWYDKNGNAYELIFARLARKYSFNPYPHYNKSNDQ